MDDRYLKQATLVVRCIPAIAKEDCFAIKGGTAINLFELNLPRLPNRNRMNTERKQNKNRM